MTKRCEWAEKEVFHKYHDNLWGIPVYNDKIHFEFLILEGAQAGLSWETILKKMLGYKKAFFDFEIKKCAELRDDYLELQMENKEIVRNRLKIFSVRRNAQIFLEIQKEFSSFNKYIWQWVDNKQIVNNFRSVQELPSKTEISNKIAKDLKKRGMNFVGSTIIYAYMQAIGMVNDHIIDCDFRKGSL